jgi:hypothetical protein
MIVGLAGRNASLRKGFQLLKPPFSILDKHAVAMIWISIEEASKTDAQ